MILNTTNTTTTTETIREEEKKNNSLVIVTINIVFFDVVGVCRLLATPLHSPKAPALLTYKTHAHSISEIGDSIVTDTIV